MTIVVYLLRMSKPSATYECVRLCDPNLSGRKDVVLWKDNLYWFGKYPDASLNMIF